MSDDEMRALTRHLFRRSTDAEPQQGTAQPTGNARNHPSRHNPNTRKRETP